MILPTGGDRKLPPHHLSAQSVRQLRGLLASLYRRTRVGDESSIVAAGFYAMSLAGFDIYIDGIAIGGRSSAPLKR